MLSFGGVSGYGGDMSCRLFLECSVRGPCVMTTVVFPPDDITPCVNGESFGPPPLVVISRIEVWRCLVVFNLPW